MLPTTRKSAPAPRLDQAAARSWVVAVEVRLPADGTWFNALAASVRSDGLFLSTTTYELEVGTPVILALSLPTGAAIVDGTVEPSEDEDGPLGVWIAFDNLSDEARERIEALHRWNAMALTELAAKVA